MVTIVQTLADTLALVIDVRMYVTVLRICVTTKLDAVYLKFVMLATMVRAVFLPVDIQATEESAKCSAHVS